jgi:hypothetical protein
MKRIAILQSNYIPWKGYFDIINMADEFVIYDEAQFTRRDWRNRNLIKTKNGLKWLTIPVEVKGRYHQKICETRISDKKWALRHWQVIKHNYSSAPYFGVYEDLFEQAYQQSSSFEFLSDVNKLFINLINSILGINTLITNTTKYQLEGNRNKKLISVCKQAGANVYISGPSAKDYIDERLFSEANVSIFWVDYTGYPEYNQKYPPFQHSLSIIDVIFNCGSDSHLFMNSFKK